MGAPNWVGACAWPICAFSVSHIRKIEGYFAHQAARLLMLGAAGVSRQTSTYDSFTHVLNGLEDELRYPISVGVIIKVERTNVRERHKKPSTSRATLTARLKS